MRLYDWRGVVDGGPGSITLPLELRHADLSRPQRRRLAIARAILVSLAIVALAAWLLA